MPIQFNFNDPNVKELLRNMMAQGATPEAAGKALARYFIENDVDFVQMVRKEMLRVYNENTPASHGYRLGSEIALQPGTAPDPVTVDPKVHMGKWHNEDINDWLSAPIIEQIKTYEVPEEKRYQVRIFDPLIDAEYAEYMSVWGVVNEPRANHVGTVVRIDTHKATNTSYNIFYVKFDDGETVPYPDWKFERLTKSKSDERK